MKFTQAKFPILKTIKNGGLPKYEMGNVSASNDEVLMVSKRINNIIANESVSYFAESVSKYISSDKFNLGSKMEELLRTDISGGGVFLYRNGVTLVYDLTCNDGKIAFEIYQLAGDNILASYHNGFIDGLNLDHQSVKASTSLINVNTIDSRMVISSLITYVIFKKYAPLETLIVNRDKTRKGILNKEKHLNEYNHDITVIDSTWFTTIIRTKGFGVQGHFGLRACGVGRTERRLVWIDAYQKDGYKRLAKKLNN